jgi:hypothetical protein
MNYILDFYPKFFDEDSRKQIFLFMPARRLRVFCRSFGPIYDRESGCYQAITPGMRMNTSYAMSELHVWQRALVCTVGNFVHLLALTGIQTPRKAYTFNRCSRP